MDWKQKTLGIVVMGGVLLVVGIMGLFIYIAATAKPLHPNPAETPSVQRVPPPSAWADTAARAREVARTSVAEQNLPGLSVAVGIGGDIVWAEGFGWADIENRMPVSPEMLFRTGTASKALTSAGVGLLLEQGGLHLDEEIQTYVPEFPRKDWPVTLRQLMGHLAGVRTDSGDEGQLLGTHCERPVDALPSFANRSLLFEPGTAYRYSSYGWILVSAAVEAAANEPLVPFMRSQVFEPLGMSDTVAESASVPTAGQVTFYFPRFAADPRYGPDVNRPIDYSCYAGASVFLSTPSDLVRFAMALNSGTLLKPETVQLLQASQRLPSGEETGYGLGWDLETVILAGQPTRVVGHDGASLGGMVASFMTFPEQGIVVAAMSNTAYADTSGLAVRIAEIFAEQKREPAGK